jgi:adenylate cyclase
LEQHIVGRQIDFLKVKGKSRATRVYEALATRETASAEQISLCNDYQQAFAAYQAHDWSGAEQQLQAILERTFDAPSAALLKRIAAFRQQPPAADWDGAFAHTSK